MKIKNSDRILIGPVEYNRDRIYVKINSSTGYVETELSLKEAEEFSLCLQSLIKELRDPIKVLCDNCKKEIKNKNYYENFFGNKLCKKCFDERKYKMI